MNELSTNVLNQWKVSKLAKHLKMLNEAYEAFNERPLYKVDLYKMDLYKLTMKSYCKLHDYKIEYDDFDFSLFDDEKLVAENTETRYVYEYYCIIDKYNKDKIIKAIQESYIHTKDNLLR